MVLADTSFSTKQIQDSFTNMGLEDKKAFHHSIMKLLDEQNRLLKYQRDRYEESFSLNNRKIRGLYYGLTSTFVNSSYARANSSNLVCHFGGWVTARYKGKCLFPWDRRVRENEEYDIFGPKYRNSCGGKELFRCNPLVFGPGDDEKGWCVHTDDSDPNLSTRACIDVFERIVYEDEHAYNRFIKGLSDNPKLLSQYIAIASESIRMCAIDSGKFSSCEDLKKLMTKTLSNVLECSVQEDLLSYLPDIITPFNLDEIDKITNGLGSAAAEYEKELEKQRQEITLYNKTILLSAIENATNDPKMEDTIKRLRDNSKKCLRNLCKKTGYKDTKPENISIARCAAYVKQAMYPFPSDDGERFSSFSEYPWGRDADDAVESSNWLTELGFENVLDYPELSHLTPENAPPGAIIVYEKVNAKRSTKVNGVKYGAPGHVELKASDNEYISDFINDEPTRIGGLRRPIGIYYQIPKQFKEKLKDLP